MASSALHDDPAVAAPVELVRSVATTRTLGVAPDAREALAFALLACAHVLGQPLPLGATEGALPTGATRRVVPGKFSPGP
jgi:1,6-anhydro-N-acetylmuramate kinase